MSSYVFILCPPYSGSTLLWKLVSTSSAVSSLPNEGQFLPEVEKWMRTAHWSDQTKMPWAEIKRAWNGYWDQDKPLLVEKSPPHILRAKEIAEHFVPSYFVIMVRNPYAHCEGLMRRDKYDAHHAAMFAVRCLRQQMRNAKELKTVLCFTYEELAGNPAATAKKIEAFLPQLGELNYAQTFSLNSIDGVVERGIVDLNQKKMRLLSVSDLKAINSVLKNNADVMDYWGYEAIEPSLRHALTYYGAVMRRFLSRCVPASVRRGRWRARQSE
jgi:hypothetical protein